VQTEQIIKRSVVGAKWVLGLSLVVVPLSYATNIILGRIGSEMLGLYGVVLIFISVITTFFFLGGNQVLVKFLPGIVEQDRIGFVLTYSVIVLSLGLLLVFALQLNPRLLTYLLKQQAVALQLWSYFLLLVPIILVLQICLATLQARMEITWMTITGKLPAVLTFLGFAVLSFLWREVFRINGASIIGAVFLVSYLAAVILAIYQVYISFVRPVPFRPKFSLPPGFWYFVAVVHLSTLLVFVLDNFDQAVILWSLDIEQLGLYRAALVTGYFVRWIPLTLMQIVFPLLSNLLAGQETFVLQEAYEKIIRYSGIVTGAVALVVVSFARQVLALFGTDYVSAATAMGILAMVYALSSASTVNSSAIVASGHVGWGLLSGVVGSVLQILVSLLLIGQLGLLAAALGKAGNLLCITILNGWFVWHRLKLTVDRRVLWLFLIEFLLTAIALVTAPRGAELLLLRNMLLGAVFCYTLFRLKLVNKQDYQQARRLLFPN